jgi:hypothetical protein
MKEKILSLLTLSALIVALASPAMAAFNIVVNGTNNLPPTYSSTGTISTDSYPILAQRFYASTLTNVNLTATLLMLQTTSGSPLVQIWSGASNPTSLITTLSLSGSFSETLANTTFTASGVTLPTTGNNYWVTLTAPTGQYDWSKTTVGGGGLYYNGTIWQNIPFPDLSFQMKLESSSATVPEPSTYALLCISLGVVGFVRKKMVKSEG